MIYISTQTRNSSGSTHKMASQKREDRPRGARRRRGNPSGRKTKIKTRKWDPPPAQSFKSHRIYGLYTHTPETQEFLEEEIERELEGRSISKINVFAEMVGSNSEVRKTIRGWANQILCLDTPQEIQYLLGRLDRRFARSPMKPSDIFSHWPMLGLARIRKKYGVEVNFQFIDASREDRAFLDQERARSQRESLLQLINTSVGQLRVQSLSLSDFGQMILTSFRRLVELDLAANKARNALVRGQLAEKCPPRTSDPGVIDIVLVGCSHFEHARGARLRGEGKIIVNGSRELNNALPSWFRTVHSEFMTAMINRVLYGDLSLEAIHLKKILLYLLIKNSLRKMFFYQQEHFPEDKKFFGFDTSQEALATRLVWKMDDEVAEDMFEQLFHPSRLDEAQSPDFAIGDQWESMLMGWLVRTYYPFPQGTPRESIRPAMIDPTQIFRVFEGIIDRHF